MEWRRPSSLGLACVLIVIASAQALPLLALADPELAAAESVFAGMVATAVLLSTDVFQFERVEQAMRLWLGMALVFLAGCGGPSSQPVVQTPVSPATTSVTGNKRIARDGEHFILPDGTRVAADERGGFRLPNGGYAAALQDGLLLPNGVRCEPDDAGGYVCP